MTQENRLAAYRTMSEVLACGRTVGEQIATIERYGGHGVCTVLRSAVLAAFLVARGVRPAGPRGLDRLEPAP